MNRRPSNVLFLAALLVASGAVVSAIWRTGEPDIDAVAVRPAMEATSADPDDPPNTFGGAQPIVSAKPGDPLGYTRLPAPKVEDGPRRIGIQVGHWMTNNVPPELRRLEIQTGTSWNGLTEVEVSLVIATQLKALLESHGYVVDLIPTTVPQGYLADVFIALHMDGDGTGENSGYKMAHGSRRGPYEQQLLDDVKDEYGKVTGLDYDQAHVSRNMLGYYAVSWQRYRSATSPFTPSVILEMGYLSNDDDRALAVDHPDVLARGIANGIERFLSEVPSTELFGKDLLLPPTRPAFSPSPSPTP
ncbi:MAG TPA: N-acetylmuramoyl-L-alanine amidase [Candidatus Limnocylindria bacterium]|nr:N-acetylmuramoyl-L-alanine amidase [Candidatus Limnocylindria bacterium]